MPGPAQRSTFILAAVAAALAGEQPGGAFPPVIALSSLDGCDGFRIAGVDVGDHAGISVSSAGDLNGDGVPDFAIGAFDASPRGRNRAGATYIVFGRGAAQDPFPAVLNLADLDGLNGFRIDGSSEFDNSGCSVAPAGDINADGIADIVIGAYGAVLNGGFYTGSAFVVFGKDAAVEGPFPPSLDLSELNGTNGFRLDGAQPGDDAGGAVSSAGDLNGDGVADLVVGANAASPHDTHNAGSTYVVFGRNVRDAGAFPARISLAALDGANGFRLDGYLPDQRTGICVAGIGDVNADGLDDLVIGSLFHDSNGSAFVVFGRKTGATAPFSPSMSLDALDGANGFCIDGAYPLDEFGEAVAGPGDVNADGIPDIVIGAPHGHSPTANRPGTAFVIFGRDTGAAGNFPPILAAMNLDGETGFRIEGLEFEEALGAAVAAGGDLNGDGVADLITGAPRADPGDRGLAGVTYVWFGRDTKSTQPFPPVIKVSALTGENGFRLDGDAPNSYSGLSVAFVGDINADGIADCIVGAPRPYSQSGAGSAYVMFGRAYCPGDANADNFVDFLDLNIVLSDFGTSATPGALAGDLNHDGVCDFLDLTIVLSYFGMAC